MTSHHDPLQRQEQQQQQPQSYGATTTSLMGSANSLPVLASSGSIESSSDDSLSSATVTSSYYASDSFVSDTTNHNHDKNNSKLFVSIGPFPTNNNDTDSSEDGSDGLDPLLSNSNSEEEEEDDDNTSSSYSSFLFKLKKKQKDRIHKNRKVLYSCLIWYVTYMIMGIVGGTVAFMHFPRTNLPYPHTLPDYGYDLIPYWCPRIPIMDDNIQSLVLLVLYGLIFGGIWTEWKTTTTTSAGYRYNKGKLILQQLLHLNSLVFLTRTTTVCVTGLPQPNPRCTGIQAFPVRYGEAFEFVVGRGFPPRACGDLIYSGHVACTLVCMTILHKHFAYMRTNIWLCGSIWSMAILGIYATISCRSHYTVDVVLAFYFIFFLREYYFLRSQGIVNGPVAKCIQWFEQQ